MRPWKRDSLSKGNRYIVTPLVIGIYYYLRVSIVVVCIIRVGKVFCNGVC